MPNDGDKWVSEAIQVNPGRFVNLQPSRPSPISRKVSAISHEAITVGRFALKKSAHISLPFGRMTTP
jgi:hypothetical protein